MTAKTSWGNNQDASSALGETPVNGCEPCTPYLAIANVPAQRWEPLYDCGKGLWCGTIFPSLHKPFFAKGGDGRD